MENFNHHSTGIGSQVGNSRRFGRDLTNLTSDEENDLVNIKAVSSANNLQDIKTNLELIKLKKHPTALTESLRQRLSSKYTNFQGTSGQMRAENPSNLMAARQNPSSEFENNLTKRHPSNNIQELSQSQTAHEKEGGYRRAYGSSRLMNLQLKQNNQQQGSRTYRPHSHTNISESNGYLGQSINSHSQFQGNQNSYILPKREPIDNNMSSEEEQDDDDEKMEAENFQKNQENLNSVPACRNELKCQEYTNDILTFCLETQVPTLTNFLDQKCV